MAGAGKSQQGEPAGSMGSIIIDVEADKGGGAQASGPKVQHIDLEAPRNGDKVSGGAQHPSDKVGGDDKAGSSFAEAQDAFRKAAEERVEAYKKSLETDPKGSVGHLAKAVLDIKELRAALQGQEPAPKIKGADGGLDKERSKSEPALKGDGDNKLVALHAAADQYVNATAKAAEQHYKASEAATEHYTKAIGAAKDQQDKALKLATNDVTATQEAKAHFAETCKAAEQQYKNALKAADQQRDQANASAKEQFAKAKPYDKDRANSAPALHDIPVHKGSVAKFAVDPAANGDGKKTLSGEIGKQVALLPGVMFREAGNATLDYAITKQIKEAEAAGKVKKTGTFEISADAKPSAIKTKQGDTEISTAQGSYGAGYAGAMAYGYSGDVKGGGAIAVAGHESGWVSRTIVKQDRFGAEVTVTERWAEGVLTVGARAEAHDSKGGAKIAAQFKTECVGEDGVKVSVTDKVTGITYSKMGVLRAEISAQGEAKAVVTWERIGIKLGASGGVEVSGTRAASMTWESGAGLGIAGTGKLMAGGLASFEDGASWNPIDGYTFSTKHRAELNFGAMLGLSPTLSTAVSTLVVGADAILGKVGAHADVTMGVKDGKFTFGVDIGGALGIGYNLKFNTQIDFTKWSDNVNRHMQTPGNYGSPGQEFRYSNPGEAVAVWLKTMFDSAPEAPAGKPPLAHTATHTEAAQYYCEMLTKLAQVEELRKLVRDAEYATLRISAQDHTLKGEAEGKILGEKIKKAHAFFKDDANPTGYKDPTLYESFPSIGEISKAMQRWFPESKLPELKEKELTFSNKLPAGFEKDFKFVMDANGKPVPSTDGAFGIFAGLSLVQYLSIKEYDLVSRMGREELAQYLGKKGDGFETTARSGHLTDAAKEKLVDYWEKAFDRGALGNPYDKQGRDVPTAPAQPNAHGANIKDDRFEAKLWDLSRSTADSKSKQMQFEDQVREFNKYYYQTAKMVAVVDKDQSAQANVTVMKMIEIPSGSVPIKDKTLGPQNFWTGETAVKFQGIPRDADKWHLIDLTPAKEGKIGLNDLIYKYTIEKLDACRSPQAVYQFLRASDWIADDGISKGELVSLWKEKHMHGEWSTASDADAQHARAWYDLHKQEFNDIR